MCVRYVRLNRRIPDNNYIASSSYGTKTGNVSKLNMIYPGDFNLSIFNIESLKPPVLQFSIKKRCHVILLLVKKILNIGNLYL